MFVTKTLKYPPYKLIDISDNQVYDMFHNMILHIKYNYDIDFDNNVYFKLYDHKYNIWLNSGDLVIKPNELFHKPRRWVLKRVIDKKLHSYIIQKHPYLTIDEIKNKDVDVL